MIEVYGAVSAMFMVLGLLEGYTDPKAKEEKTAIYAGVRDVAPAGLIAEALNA